MKTVLPLNNPGRLICHITKKPNQYFKINLIIKTSAEGRQKQENPAIKDELSVNSFD